MTQRDEIEARLRDIRDQKRLCMPGGRIIEGFEDKYERLSVEEEELRRQTERLMANEIEEIPDTEEPGAKTAEVVRLMRQAARELAAEHYGAALTLLSKALAWAEPTEEPLIERRIHDVQRRQAGRARVLEREFTRTLKAAAPDLEEAERLLLYLEQVDPNWSRLDAQRQELERHLEQRAAQERVGQFRRRLEELWRSGLLSDATEALRIAQAQAAENPDIPALQVLLEEAQQKRHKAADREETWLTSAQLGRFKETLQHFEVRISQGQTELPWYEWVQGRLTQIQYAPAEQARDHLYQLAVAYEDKKAAERLHLAQGEMPTAPRAAENRLREGLDFEYLSDARRRELETYLKGEVLPAVARREEVEKTLQAALRTRDARAAWRAVQHAEMDDPYAPGLEPARKRLRPRLRRRLERDLRSAEESRRAGRPQEVQKQADTMRILVEGDEELDDLFQVAHELVNRCVEDQELRRVVYEGLERITPLAEQKPTEADQELRIIEKRLGERIANFPEVEQLRIRIEARLGLARLLRRLEDRLRSDDDRELQRLQKQCQQLTEERPGVPELAQMVVRVEARRAFVTGEAAQVSQLFKIAREAYQKVIDLRGDDAALAQERIHQTTATEKQEQNIKAALADAQRCRQRKWYERAVSALTPWLDVASTQRLKVIELHRDIHRQWEDYTLNRLKDLMEKRPLRLRQIERLVKVLTEKLQSPEAEMWQTLALPPVYLQMAQLAEGSGELRKARGYWDKAHRYAPDDDPIIEGRRELRKRITFEKVRGLRAAGKKRLPQAEEDLLKLGDEYPTDAEIRLQLARIYLEQERYAQAKSYLQVAEELDVQREGRLVPRIEALRQLIEAEEDIANSEVQIQQLLEPGDSTFDYRNARRLYDELRRRHPPRTREFVRWYEREVQQTVCTLEGQLEQLPLEDEAGRWRLAVKIWTLDENHELARRAISDAVDAASNLKIRVNAIVMDTTGPQTDEQGRNLPAKQALLEHIRRVRDLQARARVISEALDLRDRSSGVTRSEQQEAKQSLITLNNWLGDLEKLHTQVERVSGLLPGARRSGHWPPVEEALADIQEGGRFQNHRTVLALATELQEAQSTRTRLERLVNELQQAVQKERFQHALNLLRRLRQADAKNDYGFRVRQRIRDPWDGSEIRLEGEDGVEGHTKRKLAQWNTLQGWLVPDSQRLDWPAARTAIQDRVKQGRFDDALELCEDALEGKAGEGVTNEFDGRWSLTKTRDYLADLPAELAEGEVLSQRADEALAQAKQALQAAEEAIHELEELPVRIESQKRDFEGHLRYIDGCIRQMERTRSKRRKEQLRQNAFGSLREIRTIAPNHENLPSWEGLIQSN